MTTTLEKFAGQPSRNYSRIPRLDVEILPDLVFCQRCRAEIIRVTVPLHNGSGKSFATDVWVHADEPQGFEVFPVGSWPRVKVTADHHVGPGTRCPYCHTSDPAEVVYVQAPYSDEVRCSRCDGVSGFGIGD